MDVGLSGCTSWELAKDPYIAFSLMAGRSLLPLENLVVIHEKGLGMIRVVLDADPNSRPGLVDPLVMNYFRAHIAHAAHWEEHHLDWWEPPGSRICQYA